MKSNWSDWILEYIFELFLLRGPFGDWDLEETALTCGEESEMENEKKQSIEEAIRELNARAGQCGLNIRLKASKIESDRDRVQFLAKVTGWIPYTSREGVAPKSFGVIDPDGEYYWLHP